ncbi:MAG: hypothetical protein R3A48_23050 [Polyangiales bacterium]
MREESSDGARGAVSFVEVEVDPGAADPEGLSLRFKRVAGGEARDITWVSHESESGLDGRWAVFHAEREDGPHTLGARATQVEDSSDGAVWLVSGGRQGLVLRHDASGDEERVPYLVLSLRTAMG